MKNKNIKKQFNFHKIFNNKKILITGHTGFKGSWLSAWLSLMGAKLIGVSLKEKKTASHLNYLNFVKMYKDYRFDISDYNKIKNCIVKNKPDFIFHLAAQSLVSRAHDEPLLTWNSNLIGTINVLNSLKFLKNKCSAIIITSDKCYKNLEIKKGYKEDDVLGGSDPYSASKASAELAIKSYFDTFLKGKKNIKIISCRAGNVIGGGDWSSNRIVPDCVKAWSSKKTVKIKNPNSTRPWQHVLEPINAYLSLAAALKKNFNINGESFNIGPENKSSYKVSDLVRVMSHFWGSPKWKLNKKKLFKESNLLKLNSKKIKEKIYWKPVLNFKQSVEFTIRWYKKFNKNNSNIDQETKNQIKEYMNIKQNIN